MTEYIFREVHYGYTDGTALGRTLEKQEEIVRCRDCMKWHHIDTLDGVRYGECDEWKRADSYCVPATRENGFCAWGERRTDDN